MWEYGFSLTRILPCTRIIYLVYKKDFYRSSHTQISLKITAIKICNCGYKFCKYFLFMQKEISLSLWCIAKSRSNLSQMFSKIGALKKFALFTRKHQYWSLLLIKLQKLKHIRTIASVNELSLPIKDSQCSFLVEICSREVYLSSSSSLDM